MTTTSWYRRSFFNYKGNREYTKSGYEAASARFVEKDLDVDCSDRHYMITGSNSGIGLQTALEIAKKGGIIHMVCRNKEAALKARSEIITTTGNDKIHLHIVDLGKPREVIAWSQKFAAQHERLHVLIHNAGCMIHERRVDEDGVEANFAVNTLAVHILTLTFMELLQRCDDPRMVLVSSAGMLSVRLDPHDLMHANMDPFLGQLVYSQHKRQQVVMGLWYAQRFNKVHFSSMHPGWADTPAVRTSLPQFYETMKGNLRTPAQGADTVVWLAVSMAAVKHPSGLFYQDREPVSSHFPLAWTKSTIEEEDLLMSNIQDIYMKIYNKMFPQVADMQSATETTVATGEQATTEDLKKKAEDEGTKDSKDEGQATKSEVAETSLTETKGEAEPAVIPVLPPPPAPASKVISSKLEVQEVAEIHAPPATVEDDGKTDTGEEKKEEIVEKKEEITEKAEDKKTGTEEKKEILEERKEETPQKIEQKMETPAESTSASEKEEEGTKTGEKDEGKDDATSPSPPSSDPSLPEP